MLLSDPPAAVVPPPVEAVALPLADPVPPGSPAGAAESVAVLPRAAEPAVASATRPPPAASRAAPPRRPAAQASSRAPASAARRATRKAERQATAQATVHAATKSPRRDAAAASPPPSAPRLQREMVAPPPVGERATVEEAIEAVAQAASATRVAAAAASANAERLSNMERTVDQLRADANASRELAAQMRARLLESDQSSRWTLPLLLVALMLAGLAAWLAWRLAVAQRERQQGWQLAAQAPAATAGDAAPGKLPTAPAAFLGSENRPTLPVSPISPRARPKAAPAWPPPAPTETFAAPTQAHPPPAEPPAARRTAPLPSRAPPPSPSPLPSPFQEPAETAVPPMERTDVLPAHLRIDESASRDVSIEELIDLEQQAEFFVVLGQDGSAVELLNEHLRSSGGGSPLPYLKLLDIHHRRADRKAYESIRTRFNQQFNAYAPEWGADLAAGRALGDYEGVIPRLQQVWPRPLDAMAELEALLFRKSRGDLFELPAYREVLFLYALARDLLDRGAADAGDIDLLLPMADGGQSGATSPAPHPSQQSASEPAGSARPEDQPNSALDFDLSAVERPTSIFDLLEDPPTQPLPKR